PFQRHAAVTVQESIVASEPGGAVQIGQRRLVLPQLLPGQRPVPASEQEVRIALQRGAIIRNGLCPLTGAGKGTTPVEVAPGKLGPQTDGDAEVAGGQGVLSL